VNENLSKRPVIWRLHDPVKLNEQPSLPGEGVTRRRFLQPPRDGGFLPGGEKARRFLAHQINLSKGG
jgi:hypothetical protein